ncbi:GNAT family N-acetyltransferase [Croceibacterium sp. LX-88]|uniref:GNAT family N-acetyltransferase n=1 Tax=Croceibacterium selenioxidans TaxID=2838833 RepID=A0ABS5W143_9SPHN|nr:GNAT family N-acetyltransferase [Croceibacterium selenioxidans]MBT2133481.1 GNAT family N-acetyltransferase [Croceibacterium selenioxidans]
MAAGLRFAPLEPDPVLFDPEQTGDFAKELAKEAAKEQLPPWCSWIGWLDGIPVTMGGFTGPPTEDGTVEIGYLTFTDHQGRGHATALTGFLVATARRGGVARIIAHTLSEPNASTRVLEKNGFVRDGEAHDPDAGTVWRWSLCVAEA